jgi:hypothetical protein
MIEHLVITSGGPLGIVQLGMLSEAFSAGLLDVNTLKTIHGCSSGAILGCAICLKIPIQDIVDYIITRKWEKWIQYDIQNFYINRGLVDNSCIAEIIIPFFKAYDVPLTITMEEFYQLTGIDYYVLTTEVNEMKSVTLHHSTFPDLPVLTAITMSSAIPFAFPPVKYKEKYYIDGVCRRHCPHVDYPEDTVCIINVDTSIFDTESVEDDASVYFQQLLLKSYRILTHSDTIPQGRTFTCTNVPSIVNGDLWKRSIQDPSYREMLINIGKTLVQTKLSETANEI